MVASKETTIKAKLLDHFLEDPEPDMIAILELPFAGFRRRADIVFVGKQLIGIEIKSDSDDLSSLTAQAEDYVKSFDFAFLACSSKYVDAARQLIPRSMGIIRLGKDRVEILRNPRQRKRLNKRYLAQHIERREIESICRKNSMEAHRTDSIDTLRAKLVERIPTGVLREVVLTSLSEKYASIFHTFLRERGKVTTQDDLKILRCSPNSGLKKYSFTFSSANLSASRTDIPRI